MESPLYGTRVLDLAGPIGVYCTKLLADLGADVVRIEPPEGDPARRTGPFYHDEPHPEKSLRFFHYNTSKRSITLSLETADGRVLLKRLAATADILVETFAPGYMDGLGIGYKHLSAINPRIIVTSITPFGQTGPYRHWKGADIVGQAMGGLMYLIGFPDRAPTQVGGNQGYHQASLHGCAATLIALYHQRLTGEGQHVDQSMHDAVPLSQQTGTPYYAIKGESRVRPGDHRESPARGYFECKDGGVFGTRVDPRYWHELLDWMESEGYDVARFRTEEWSQEKYRQEHQAEFNSVLEVFFKDKTRDEICDEAQRRHIWICQVNTAADLLRDPQLVDGGYFLQVEHPDLQDVLTYPGAPFRMEATPWHIRRSAPRTGENNEEIYVQELGLTPEELVTLKSAGVI